MEFRPSAAVEHGRIAQPWTLLPACQAARGIDVETSVALFAFYDPRDDATFVSNDRLKGVLDQTDATPAQVDAAVAVNEQARLSALKLGLLILAGVSALATVPAGGLPKYRPGEIPESVATGATTGPHSVDVRSNPYS